MIAASTRAALPGPWTDRAACHGQGDLFFPPIGRCEPEAERAARVAAARTLCHGCPVRSECADFAATNHERHGIWGGRVLDRPRRPIGRPPRLTVVEGP